MTLSTRPTHLVVFLVALTCILTFTQTASAQRCDKRPEDLKFVREMKDPGADLAVVVAKHSTIYADPNANRKPLLSVKRGDFLALVKRDPVRTWYRVVEINTATEGWIYDCDVIIKLTAQSQTGPPLEQEQIGTNQNPELNVSNQEPSTNLNLRINGTLYIIAANTTKTLTLKPGRYEFYGYSPGVRPAFGNEIFKAGIRYSWTFRIVRR